MQETEDTSQNPWRLTLKDVTEKNEGWYSCVVKNILGFEYQSAYLEVLSKFDSVYMCVCVCVCVSAVSRVRVCVCLPVHNLLSAASELLV